MTQLLLSYSDLGWESKMRKQIVRVLAAISIVAGVLGVSSSAQAATSSTATPRVHSQHHIVMKPADWWIF